jgi:rhamnosyltransferase
VQVTAYISSFNSLTSVTRCVQALLDQTYPVTEIIIVDNRSSDGTPNHSFPDKVTLICHLRNLGVGGAAATAFEYGLANGREWMWVLDQDTVPKQDALEKLVEFYESLRERDQQRVGILSSLVILRPSEAAVHGRRLTRGGPRPARLDPAHPAYDCDATIWSGSLYRLDVVRRVGMPRFGATGCWEDFSMDYGDLEFSFRIRRAGYRIIGHGGSRILHEVGEVRHCRIFPRWIYSTNHSPFRRYLYFRNMTYFWLYLYPGRHLARIALYLAYRLLANTVKIAALERNRRRKIAACLAGIWDGVRRDLTHRRYLDG